MKILNRLRELKSGSEKLESNRISTQEKLSVLSNSEEYGIGAITKHDAVIYELPDLVKLMTLHKL